MTNQDRIEIRLLGLGDGAAIRRLPEVDTASAPPAPLLGRLGRPLTSDMTAGDDSLRDGPMSGGATSGTIGIRTRPRERRRAGWLTRFRAHVRERRRQRARRAHALRAGKARAPYVPGSEHTHLLPRSRGF